LSLRYEYPLEPKLDNFSPKDNGVLYANLDGSRRLKVSMPIVFNPVIAAPPAPNVPEPNPVIPAPPNA
jgi:hypothetical protein